MARYQALLHMVMMKWGLVEQLVMAILLCASFHGNKEFVCVTNFFIFQIWWCAIVRPQAWPRFILKELCSLGLPAYMFSNPLRVRITVSTNISNSLSTRPLLIRKHIAKESTHRSTFCTTYLTKFIYQKDMTLENTLPGHQANHPTNFNAISLLQMPPAHRPYSQSAIQRAAPTLPV
jgi:hypothetical protein